jgi:subtilisin family serine protease
VSGLSARRRFFAVLPTLWVIMLALVVAFAVQASATTPPPAVSVLIDDEITRMVTATGQARVLLLLGENGSPNTAAAVEPAAVATLQKRFLQTVTTTEFQIYRQYQFVPGVAGTVTAAGLDNLRANPLVRAVQLDHPGGAHLQESLPAIGGDIVHNRYGITGRGVTVAVLDSGIDTDHPDLADDLVAQHCFTNSACLPGSTNQSNSAEDENGHGTNVAGIITANGTVSGRGFAPNAKIVAVRVLDKGGIGFVADWVAGLDWVYSQLATTPVQIVNLSLGTSVLYPDNCDKEEPLLAAAIAQLRAKGVAFFASSGNQGHSTRIAAPACNSGVIAVGATYDSNVGRQPPSGTYQSFFGGSWPACSDSATTLRTITCFTNSNQQLDLLAPGAPLLSAYLNGKTALYRGTSQASPTAAGVAALLLEKRPGLRPAEVEKILKTSGSTVTNPSNGLAFPLINALAAIQAITPISPTAVALTGAVTGVTNVAYGFVAAVTPVTVTTPLTYHWQATDLPMITTIGAQQNRYTFIWGTPGPKVITVTARNEGGQVRMSHAITIAASAPVIATIDGPTLLATGGTSAFQAMAMPITTTTPITYHWRHTDALPITRTGGISDVLLLAWATPGVKLITVTLENAAGRITATHAVTVQLVAPLTVTVDAPLTTAVGLSTTVRAQVQPTNGSLPLTYTWQATDQLPLTRTTSFSDTVVYRWSTPGLMTITVQTQNRAGMVANQRRIVVIDDRRLYLPLIQRP